MRQKIIIKELPPGLNGSDGLMNMHWSKYQKIKKQWAWLVRAEKPEKHEGRVSIHYTRVSTAPMDYDNIGASFKVIGDALEDNNVIADDSPKTIERLTVDWQKAVSRKEQGVVIEIENAE